MLKAVNLIMIGIYFSGTGNTRHCIEKFTKAYDPEAIVYSIEDIRLPELIRSETEIVFGYPTQYSSMPKILRDFMIQNQELWQGKKVFILTTMRMFSGDGAGVLARLLKTFGAAVTGGLHLKMPDSISDEKVLKTTLEKNRQLVTESEEKIKKAVQKLQMGKPPQEGLGAFSHLAGLFGQRLYFYNKTKRYTDKLTIHSKKCIGCGKCVKLCPMKNIVMENGIAKSGDQCTMCYRCINHCPKQAITLLGHRVYEQGWIEKYLQK